MGHTKVQEQGTLNLNNPIHQEQNFGLTYHGIRV